MRRTPALAVLALALLVLTGCGGATRAQQRATVPHAAGPYAALGDSYSAAPGVPTLDIASGCLRSSNNYPHLIAAAVPGLTLTDVTCSGATTASLTTSQQTAAALGLSVPPQLDAVTAATRYVTLSIGGNDQGLFSSLLACLSKGSCRASFGGRVDTEIDTVGKHLTQALRAIHQKAPHAQVALVGYPQIMPASGTCTLLRIDETDRAFVHRVFVRISQRMAQAAEDGDARYIDVLTASKGHDICATVPWVNGPQTNAQGFAYHPYLAEQRAVAELVVKAFS